MWSSWNGDAVRARGLQDRRAVRDFKFLVVDQLADQIVVPTHTALPPTPQEIECVVQGAQRHLLLGYKRLAYALMAENKAFLRPWMVRDILDQRQLLGRRAPAPEPLVRPPVADHPDQRWHTDLSMWWFDEQWFWMIDILVAYSRYLVHCELLLTAKTDAVERAVQHASCPSRGRPAPVPAHRALRLRAAAGD
jgi:hypothetical protein